MEASLHKGNVGVGVLQEMNQTRGIHMRYISVYRVCSMEAESHHRGGIAIVWWEQAVCQVEGTTNYGPNMVSFIIMEGCKRWFVVGSYITINNQQKEHWVEQDLSRGLVGT